MHRASGLPFAGDAYPERGVGLVCEAAVHAELLHLELTAQDGDPLETMVGLAAGVLGGESERDAPLGVHGDSGQRVPASRRLLEVEFLTGQRAVDGAGLLGTAVWSDEQAHW